MPVTITITEDTPQAAVNALVGIAVPFMRAATQQAQQTQPAPKEEVVGGNDKVLEGEVLPPAKPKRNKRTDEPKQTDAVQTDLEQKIAETPKDIVVQDVRDALKGLGESKGTDAVFALLGEYKVKNATEAFNAGKGAEIVTKANELAAA